MSTRVPVGYGYNIKREPGEEEPGEEVWFEPEEEEPGEEEPGEEEPGDDEGPGEEEPSRLGLQRAYNELKKRKVTEMEYIELSNDCQRRIELKNDELDAKNDELDAKNERILILEQKNKEANKLISNFRKEVERKEEEVEKKKVTIKELREELFKSEKRFTSVRFFLMDELAIHYGGKVGLKPLQLDDFMLLPDFMKQFHQVVNDDGYLNGSY